MESMDTGSQALAVRYIQKPQDGHADTVVKVSFSPSYVTYNPVTIQNVQSFFNTGEASPTINSGNNKGTAGQIQHANFDGNCCLCSDSHITWLCVKVCESYRSALDCSMLMAIQCELFHLECLACQTKGTFMYGKFIAC